MFPRLVIYDRGNVTLVTTGVGSRLRRTIELWDGVDSYSGRESV